MKKINILKEVEEIRYRLSKISNAMAADDFVEIMKIWNHEYLIEKIKNIKEDADNIIEKIKYRKKNIRNK